MPTLSTPAALTAGDILSPFPPYSVGVRFASSPELNYCQFDLK
jgi:hypothetical protein